MGRPRISADARLDELFLRDYEARQIFDFLKVTTVRELEAYTPDEIIQRLTEPIAQTVQRIRKVLAMHNRSLAGDRAFAYDFKQSLKR
ncbi:MAG: hypothetical protein GXP27_20480 [Planctomycetes bacterium]|nr:hypothetical protein [Planctomycetota bacterium]